VEHQQPIEPTLLLIQCAAERLQPGERAIERAFLFAKWPTGCGPDGERAIRWRWADRPDRTARSDGSMAKPQPAGPGHCPSNLAARGHARIYVPHHALRELRRRATVEPRVVVANMGSAISSARTTH
jgi:hypothetical protein